MIPTAPAGLPVVREVRASLAQQTRWRGAAFDVVNRVYRLRGRLVPDALGYALDTVIGGHEALRCSLHDDGELVMRVYERVPAPLRRIVAEGGVPAEREAWLATWVAEEVRRPFDRSRAPLLRATLVRLDGADHVLVLVIDHIVADGWSVELLVRELSAAYRAATGEDAAIGEDAALGEEPAPPDQVGQYPDWVVQERAGLDEERLAARAAFWRDRFPGGPTDVAVWLSGYRRDAGPGRAATAPAIAGVVRDADTGCAGATSTERRPAGAGERCAGVVDATLGAELTEALRRTARQLRVTLNVLTATVLVRLLQRDTRQQRVTLSTSSASRFSPQTASMIGYLARTIWVPTTLGGDLALPAAVLAFNRDLLRAMANSDVPVRSVFERLWGRGARTMMDAVPQVGFLCTPFWGDSLVLPGVDVEASEYEDGSADATLSVYLTDRGSRIDVQVRFMPDLLEDGYAGRILDGYLADLAAAA